MTNHPSWRSLNHLSRLVEKDTQHDTIGSILSTSVSSINHDGVTRTPSTFGDLSYYIYCLSFKPRDGLAIRYVSKIPFSSILYTWLQKIIIGRNIYFDVFWCYWSHIHIKHETFLWIIIMSNYWLFKL